MSKKWGCFIYFNITSSLTTTLKTLKDYQDLFRKEDKEALGKLETLEAEIKKQEQTLKDSKESILKEIKKLIEAKKKEPYKKIEDFIYYEDLEDDLKKYIEEIGKAKSIIDSFINRIDELKKPYRENTKQAEIEDLEKRLKSLELEEKRIEQDKDCQKYIETKTEIENLEKEEKKLNDDIVNQQSDYLKDYFKNINDLFKAFGSKDFVLKKQDNSRGHKKVYGLLVKYKDKQIDNGNLSKVFSESDKRALALAIFFTKIQLKPENEQKETIIILDDPITSFDDNRITSTINITKNILDKVNQIIILTHYNHYIKRFYEVCNSYDSAILYQLDTVS